MSVFSNKVMSALSPNVSFKKKETEQPDIPPPIIQILILSTNLILLNYNKDVNA